MEILKIKSLTEYQFHQINEMWNEEFPINLKDRFDLLLEDVENYNHYIISENDQILAWAADFETENEVRFSIIVRKENQGKGLGKLLIDRLKRDLGEFCGWVIDHNDYLKQNGETYQSPLSFYKKHGFEILNDIRSASELIKAVKIRNNVKIFAETERFILREILPSDVEGMFELDSDADVHQYLGNNPVSKSQQSLEMIYFIRQQYLDHGIGRWAIIDKSTNVFVGWSGLKFVTDLTNNHQNYYDLGYRLIKKYWGQGIATETAIASVEYAFDKIGANEVYAMVDFENHNSQKILKKVGLNPIESFDFDGIKHDWFKIDRVQFEKSVKLVY